MFVAFKNSSSRCTMFAIFCLVFAFAASNYFKNLEQEFGQIQLADKTVNMDEDFDEEVAVLISQLHKAEKKGLENERIFKCLRQLADCCFNKGRYHQSENYYNILLSRMKTKYGAADFRLVPVMDALAEVYSEDGRYSNGDFSKVYEDPILKPARSEYEKAETLLSESIKLEVKKLGRNNVAVANSLLKLGRIYNAQAEWSKAEDSFLKALSIYESALGPNDPVLVEPLSELSFLYNQDVLGCDLKSSDEEISLIEKRCNRIFMAAYRGEFNRTIAIKPAAGRALIRNVHINKADVDTMGHQAEIDFPVTMGLSPSIQKKVQKELSLQSVFGDYEELSGWLTNVSYEVTYNQNNILSVEYRLEGSGAYPSWQYEYVCVDLKTGKKMELEDVVRKSSFDSVARMIDPKMKASLVSEMEESPEESDYIKETYNQALSQTTEVESEKIVPFTAKNLGQFSIHEGGIQFRFDFEFPHIAKANEPENDYMISFKRMKPHLKPDGPLEFLVSH